MHFIKLVLFTLIVIFIIPTVGFSQEETKTKVVFYGDFYRITKLMDEKLNLFSEKYPSFVAAELYRFNEQGYQLEIEQKKNGEIRITTVQMSQKETEALKNKIAQRIKEEDIVWKYDHSGRFLKVQSNALQGAIGGHALASLLWDKQDGLNTGMPYLGFGSGILGGILGTAKRDVPLAPTIGYASGAFNGAVHGFLVGSIIAEIDDGIYNKSSTIMLTSTAFSVGESLLFQHIIKKNKWSAKRASALRIGNFSGGITGGGLSLILGGERVNKYVSTIFTLGGSVSGILLYDKYFRNREIEVGNMQAIRLMNPIFTAGTTIVIGNLANFDSNASLGAAIMATSIGGVFLGEALFKNGHVTYGESLWYGLGLYGGFYIGIGISEIVRVYSTDNYLNISPSIAGIISLTSIGGMYIVHSIVANDIDDGEEIGFLERNNIHISANPGAVFMNKVLNNPLQQQNAVSIRWTF